MMKKLNQAICGFTLLEVLITVTIFSIGLLGLGGLQVKGIMLANDSLLRTTATLLANDMADRMRSNVTAAKLGVTSAYNNPTGISSGNPSCLGKNSLGNYLNTQCTDTQMALHDFYEWYGAIQGQAATSWHPAQNALLPASSGVVCIDSTPNDGAPNNPQCDNIVLNTNVPIFTIKIWWHERKLDQNNNMSLHAYITNVAL